MHRATKAWTSDVGGGLIVQLGQSIFALISPRIGDSNVDHNTSFVKFDLWTSRMEFNSFATKPPHLLCK
jgi:hypothetical protein